MLQSLVGKLSRHRRILYEIGLWNWSRVFLRSVQGILLQGKYQFWIRSKYAKFPLICRIRTSDLRVFRQIFVEREYSCLDDVVNPGLIIDCGANVGYSSAYFLSRFPLCKVISVEPDPDNYQTLAKNLAPFGDRSTVIWAGVWSHTTRLVISETRNGPGNEWGRQVREGACRE